MAATKKVKPVIMGILNVTPDSFSDGGDFYNPEDAVRHGIKMVAEGVDIIDVGGESTRPGSVRIEADEQIRRVVPVIKKLREEIPGHIIISIDTTLPRVVEAAVEAGAGMINDIAAGEDDKDIFRLAAENKLPLVLMHKQGIPESMQDKPVYEDVVEEIRRYLLDRAEVAISSGVKQESLILDPGFGFGKTLSHNIQLMMNLGRLVDTGIDVLIGTSRKTFLSKICVVEDRKDLVGATCATTAIGVMAGVKYFRVHDVRENRQAVEIIEAVSGPGQ